jgi:hypothetical protein
MGTHANQPLLIRELTIESELDLSSRLSKPSRNDSNKTATLLE